MNRREFNKWIAGGTGAACLGVFSVANGKVQVALPSSFDEIDHFSIAHRLRDGEQFSFPEPSAEKEVVIVGGGLSGMITAHRLDEMDTLILEKEPTVGGNSRRRQSNGIQYPLGAVTSQGAEAPFTSYFNELKVPFQKVQGPDMAYFVKGKRIIDPFGAGAESLPFNQKIKDQFKGLKAHLSQYLDTKNGIYFPRSSNVKPIRDLDKITLYQYFKEQGYYPETIRFLDDILATRMGCSGENVSAWMGLYILSRAVTDVYTLPGGHGAISEILADKLNQDDTTELRSGFTTLSVKNMDDDHVWVSGIDSHGGLKTIQAQAAVLAVPKFYANRIVPDLSAERKAIIQKFQYNAYMVAQVELTQPISDTFETINDGLLSKIMMRPDWLPNNKGENGTSHLTIYAPFTGREGRMKLYTSSANGLAEQIVNDIETVFPGGSKHISKISLHRWGHPMITPAPGIDSQMETLIEPHGATFFSHSDSSGITGLYSAVWAGMQASNDVLLHFMDD